MRFELSRLDILLIGVTSAVLGGGVGWCVSSPGYEPVLAIFAGAAGLVQCVVSVNRKRVVPADRERFRRLALSVLPGLDFLKKQDFEGAFLDWKLDPVRDFRKLAEDLSNRFADPELERHRQEALEACVDFSAAVGQFTFLKKDDVRGGDDWFKSHDNAEFIRRGRVMNDRANEASSALHRFLEAGSSRFPDVDLHVDEEE